MLRPLLLILLFCQWASADPLVEIEKRFYTVNANSIQQLPTALNKATPIKQAGKPYHAYTDSKIRWQFQWQSAESTCYIDTVTVEVKVVFTLPRLSSKSPDVERLWDRWFPMLMQHENRHKDHALNIARMIEQAILDLPEFSRCSELETAANRAGNRLISQLQKTDEAYDRDTQHGKIEGAWIESYLQMHLPELKEFNAGN